MGTSRQALTIRDQSDHQVIAQVVHEYPPLVTALLQSGLPVRTVLDAGANAGFSKRGSNSLCREPYTHMHIVVP